MHEQLRSNVAFSKFLQNETVVIYPYNAFQLSLLFSYQEPIAWLGMRTFHLCSNKTLLQQKSNYRRIKKGFMMIESV